MIVSWYLTASSLFSSGHSIPLFSIDLIPATILWRDILLDSRGAHLPGVKCGLSELELERALPIFFLSCTRHSPYFSPYSSKNHTSAPTSAWRLYRGGLLSDSSAPDSFPPLSLRCPSPRWIQTPNGLGPLDSAWHLSSIQQITNDQSPVVKVPIRHQSEFVSKYQIS